MMQWDSQQRFWLYILISSSIGFFILILIIIGLRKRIRNSIQVMKMASRALSSTPGTVIFPILPFVFAIGSLLVFVIGFLSLHTMDVNMTADYLQWLSDYALLFKFIFIFVVIWMIGFIAGFQKVGQKCFCISNNFYVGNTSWCLCRTLLDGQRVTCIWILARASIPHGINCIWIIYLSLPSIYYRDTDPFGKVEKIDEKNEKDRFVCSVHRWLHGTHCKLCNRSNVYYCCHQGERILPLSLDRYTFDENCDFWPKFLCFYPKVLTRIFPPPRR